MITRLITSGLLIAFGIIILRYAIAKKRCLGIACCMFAYQDMKEHPVSKWTTAYLSQLGGYFAGICFILYGIGLLK